MCAGESLRGSHLSLFTPKPTSAFDSDVVYLCVPPWWVYSGQIGGCWNGLWFEGIEVEQRLRFGWLAAAHIM